MRPAEQLAQFPSADALPQGAFVLGLDGVERTSLRWGLFGALAGAFLLGAVLGWIFKPAKRESVSAPAVQPRKPRMNLPEPKPRPAMDASQASSEVQLAMIRSKS